MGCTGWWDKGNSRQQHCSRAAAVLLIFSCGFYTPKKQDFPYLKISMNGMKKAIIIEVISYLLILLFSYAAVSKLSDYSNFKVQLSQSPITTGYATLIARFLPPVELLIAGALVVPGIRLPGLYASLFLM